MVKKTCSTCKESKSIEEFHKSCKLCKPCNIAHVRAWRVKNGLLKGTREKTKIKTNNAGEKFRTCSKCLEDKFLNKFTFLKSQGKHLTACKSCESRRKMEWAKKYEDKDKKRAKTRERYNNNKEKFKAYQDEYRSREGVQDSRNKLGREYYQKNKEKMRAIKSSHEVKRRARKKGLSVLWDEYIAGRALSAWKDKCCYCYKDVTQLTHFDHFIPLSNPNCPGTVPWNMVPSCQKCNNRKYNKDPYKWLGVRGLKILNKIEVYLDDMRQIYS